MNTTATGEPTITGTIWVRRSRRIPRLIRLRRPEQRTFTYQWLADDADITDATGSTYALVAADEGKTIKVRVTFTDDSGHQETLTSAATVAVASAPTPLTAAIHDAPGSHNGQTALKFELRFSEDPKEDFSYKTLRDHAFTVTGGTVAGARRLDGDSDTRNIKWQRHPGRRTRTAPSSSSATTDCDAQGAICAEDGRVLVQPAEIHRSFESVPTSHNGSDSCPHQGRAPKYTTMRDHAFTVTGGSVTGARRLVSGKNLRWEIVVSPDSNGDVTITLPATTDCDAQGAICADGDKKLSNRLERTVSGPGE